MKYDDENAAPWIGKPIAGHTGYALNIPSLQGWIVERFAGIVECKERATQLGWDAESLQ